jgi:APA family basic amino acid/polyamine antiporter
VAILGQTIVSWIIVGFGYDNVNFLLSIILFGGLVFNTLIFLSVFKFRKTMPKAERPYKVWGFPYVPSLAILGMLILLVVTMFNSFQASMVGVFVILIGNGFYDVFMAGDRLPPAVSDTPAPVTLATTKVATKKVTKRKSK